MKKILLFTLFIFTLSLSYQEAKSQIDIGFQLGLSTPSESLADVYNSDLMSFDDDVYANLYHKGIDLGFHVGVKARISLVDDFDFIAGFTYHSFTSSDMVFDFENTELYDEVPMESKQKIFNLNAGINYYLFKSVASMYIISELQYNSINNSLTPLVDFFSNVDLNPSNSRVGVGVGLGLDVDFVVLSGVVEAKYNIINLIGKESNEDTKSFFSLSFGVYL